MFGLLILNFVAILSAPAGCPGGWLEEEKHDVRSIFSTPWSEVGDERLKKIPKTFYLGWYKYEISNLLPYTI